MKYIDDVCNIMSKFSNSYELNERLPELSMAICRHLDYPVVTLIGSTKFKLEFDFVRMRLNYIGWIVNSVAYFSHTYESNNDLYKCPDTTICMYGPIKRRFDAQYMQYIKNSDACVIINKNGYMGLSSTDELLYAISLKKPVLFTEPLSGECLEDYKTLFIDNGYTVQVYAPEQPNMCLGFTN